MAARRTHRRPAIIVIALALLACVLPATAPGQTPTKAPVADPPKPAVGLDAIKVPPGAIVVLMDGARDALQKIEGVWMTPEKYKELSDLIEQLKRQAAPAKPAVPSACKLSGQVESRGGQEFVRLQAVYEFRTTSPRSVLSLACQKAKPVSAAIDGDQLPDLFPGDDGLNVRVESAGPHSLTLELELPVLTRGSKGTERGFELDLPGSPITILKWDAPRGVSKLSLGGKRFDADRLRGGEALGGVKSLDVAWETPAAPAAEPPPTSDASIHVRVEDNALFTEATLRLKGSLKEWRLLAPANAELTVEGTNPTVPGPETVPLDPPPTVVRPNDPSKPPVWLIQFPDAAPRELTVKASLRTPRPKNPAPVPVGPFALLGAARQQGVIAVGAPAHLGVTPKPRVELRRRDPVGDDPNAETVYSYTLQATQGNQTPPPPMELEVRTLEGRVQTQTTHRLRLVDGGWRLETEVQATPFRTEVEAVEIEVPAELQNLDVGPPRLVEGVRPLRELGPQRRLVQVRLAGPQREPFRFKLEGFYPLAPSAQDAALNLPRPRQTYDRDGQVSASVSEGIELHGRVTEWDGDRIEEPGRLLAVSAPARSATGGPPPVTLGATCRLTPARVTLAWKPFRPELTAESVADVTLLDRQAVVSQTIKFKYTPTAPRQVRLRGAGMSGLRLTQGAGAVEAGVPGEWLVNLPADSRADFALTFAYYFPLPEMPRPGAEGVRVVVPVLAPDGTDGWEARARVWAPPGTAGHWQPALGDGSWQEQPLEAVAGRDRLPALVARGGSVGQPLSLSLTTVNGGSMAGVMIERALVQAVLNEGGGQTVRARYLLRRWSAPTIEFELPAPAAALNLEARVDDQLADWRDDADGRVVRLPLLPERAGKPLVIELRYQLSADGAGGFGGRSVRRDVPMPRPRGPVFLGTVAVQVGMPGSWVALAPGPSATFDARWGWHRGLLTPRAGQSTADLDSWFRAGVEPLPESPTLPPGEEYLVARQAAFTPLTLYVLPRGAWLLGCSLLVLVGGLFLSLLRPARGVFWSALMLTGAVLAFAAFSWPQPAGQFFSGAEPGALALGLVTGGLALLHRRYRRRVENMSAFSRAPANSSVVRTATPRPRREPSTVDSPGQPDGWAPPTPSEQLRTTG
jgi:hypothetical protein